MNQTQKNLARIFHRLLPSKATLCANADSVLPHFPTTIANQDALSEANPHGKQAEREKCGLERRAFIAGGCACGALLLAGTSRSAADTADPKPTTNAPTNPINPAQVMSVLSDIDRTSDWSLIDAVFSRWGYQCFHQRSELKAFAERQRANFQGYIDYVNQGRARYWEKLEYDQAGGVLKVTSRKSGKCACAYAQCPQPAKALCTHCCKAFQTELFKTMTGREVRVQIDETILLGGERCRTTIHLLEKAQPYGASPS